MLLNMLPSMSGDGPAATPPAALLAQLVEGWMPTGILKEAIEVIHGQYSGFR
jgi:hypothetical protein